MTWPLLHAKTSAPGSDRRSGGLRKWQRKGGGVLADVTIQAAVVILLLATWEAAARTGLVTPFLLPALSDVLARIWSDALSGTAFVDLAFTLYRALAGFAVAAAIGIPLGILMARSPAARWLFDPLISIGFPMPKIAFLPIFILWFGVFDSSKITMAAFSCVFPIVSATYAGALGVDKWPMWSARSLGAEERELLWEVILPLATPQILTGLQIALPVALITTIVSEMLMGGPGLGGAMMAAGRFADSVGVFAGIVEIAILGFAAVRSLVIIRARLLAWHVEASAQ